MSASRCHIDSPSQASAAGDDVALSESQIIGHLHPKIAKDLLRRGYKVQARAKKLLSGESGHPKRVDTGHLRSSVQVQLRSIAGTPVVRVGTDVKYSRWVHDGTGIYGPRRRLIRARRSGGVLTFVPKGGRKRIFVRHVRGIRPNHFLTDALPAARD